MKFDLLYRSSLNVMLVLAAMVLCMDITGENPLSRFYPVGVAAVAVLTFLLVDRRSAPGLPRHWANALACLSFLIAYLEWAFDPESLVLILGHWLIYLTLIKLSLPKTIEDDWFLILLGLVQVMVGVTLSQSDLVGATLLVWSLTTLWVLALFYLHREARSIWAANGVASLPDATPDEPYPGLVETPFILSTVRVAAVTMALGGVIFLVMPRNSRPDRISARTGVPATHLTGFSDTVQLGQLGEILENESIVMSVELLDEKNNPIDPPPEPLWRGVAMVQYENKRWHRAFLTVAGVRARFDWPPEPRTLLRQKFKLEPTDSHVLFALRPIIWSKGEPNNHPEFNPRDGSLYREELNSRKRYEFEAPNSQPSGYEYEVLSEPDTGEDRVQAGEDYPSHRHLAALKEVPKGLAGRFKAIADRVIGGVPEDDVIGRAGKINQWLGFSGEFHYTLKLDPVDRSLDPIEDFLTNRKEGHCEYFASAMTLLLRSEGIPARMVNGFKGGDWGQLTRVINVRQKHAHTWVEALVGRDERGRPIWKTFDPTSGTERGAMVARVGGLAGNLRAVSDFIRYVWVFYVIGFNAERQERMLYGPLRRLAMNARDGFGIMGDAAYHALLWLLDFRGGISLILLRGVLLVVAFLLLQMVLFRAGRRAFRRLLGSGERAAAGESAQAVGFAFYARAARLLGEYGLDRPPAETPREFARRASALLGARGTVAEAVADVPALVVDVYYRIRYGHFEPAPDDLKHVESRLDALEASLQIARDSA